MDEILEQARTADPGDRILFRDGIAAHGAVAIDAMVDWIGDPRLAAFAIRVLGKVGQDRALGPAVIEVLKGVDRTVLPTPVQGDLDWTLESLGYTPRAAAQRLRSRSSTERSIGRRGQPGRGYWVMRTSPWERPFIWSEAIAGRLRQGWGSVDEQNLEVVADLLHRGAPLNEDQQATRRALRMLTSWDDGMRVGDLVVGPNLPDYGQLSVFRVAGSYRWSPAPKHAFGERFGHVLPVELLVPAISRWSTVVSDGLRSALRVQTRLYNINGYGGDVEQLVGGTHSAGRWSELWTSSEYEILFGRFPPEGERPAAADIDLLAVELGRTPDAISWQWGDGASYINGGSASTTSEPLKKWLDDRERSRIE